MSSHRIFYQTRRPPDGVGPGFAAGPRGHARILDPVAVGRRQQRRCRVDPARPRRAAGRQERHLPAPRIQGPREWERSRSRMPLAGWHAGEWHQIGATWDGRLLWLFIDGVPRHFKTSPAPMRAAFPPATADLGSPLSTLRSAQASVPASSAGTCAEARRGARRNRTCSKSFAPVRRWQ